VSRVAAEAPANAVSFPCDLRWTDFDGYQHLHSSAHVVVLENTRARFINAVLRSTEVVVEWVLVHLTLDIVGELRPADGFRCQCRIGIESAGRSSLTTWEAIESPTGRVVSRARAVIVLWDPSFHSKVSLTADQRAALSDVGVAQSDPG
jgi:acyl-CoA thioesterase FadM